SEELQHLARVIARNERPTGQSEGLFYVGVGCDNVHESFVESYLPGAKRYLKSRLPRGTFEHRAEVRDDANVDDAQCCNQCDTTGDPAEHERETSGCPEVISGAHGSKKR